MLGSKEMEPLPLVSTNRAAMTKHTRTDFMIQGPGECGGGRQKSDPAPEKDNGGSGLKTEEERLVAWLRRAC